MADVFCAAPFVSMDFDPFGNVQVCCANSIYPIGNVATESLREIWDGARVTTLRRAMERHDLSVGCMVCRHRGTFSAGEVPRDYFDEFPVPATPEWPQLLAFSLHNTCNLECIMCGADLSSRIRSHREHLAPLPHVYGDAFFEQVEPFLANCSAIDLAGGEPFLVPEHRRIWAALAQLGVRPKVSVTTNGTVWNDHVEDVLAHHDINVCVSFDGVTPATFERVRTGASFDVVLRNLDRFQAYADERGTGVFLSFSMVKQNWFELGSVLRFAEERGMEVSVQTVQEPDFGVQWLPTDELAVVVETLEAEDRALGGSLTLNGDTWRAQVDRLRSELAERRAGGRRPPIMEPPSDRNAIDVERAIVALLGPDAADAPPDGAAAAAAADAELDRWSPGAGVGHVEVDGSGRVVTAALDAVLPAGTELPDVVGGTLADLLGSVERATGTSMWIGESVTEPGRVLHTLWFSLAPRGRDRSGFVVRTISVRTADGVTTSLATDGHLMPTAVPVPVSVSVALAGRGRPAAGR